MAAPEAVASPGARGGAAETVAAQLLTWVQLQRAAATTTSDASLRPFVLGLSGVQGAGKTSLARYLESSLRANGLVLVGLSLDDFYLPHADLCRLAAKHNANPLLQHRGNPGTHDVSLLLNVLDGLKRLPTSLDHQNLPPGHAVAIPIFDKALNQGQGDRLPKEQWRQEHGPVDVVLLEGWMMGFTPWLGPLEELARYHPGLLDVDHYLQTYPAIYERLDAFVQIAVRSLDVVYGWRLQAEQQMARERGRDCMSDAQVRRFVDNFMPSYHAYLPRLVTQPPCASRAIQIWLDADRSVIRIVRPAVPSSALS